MLFDVMALQEIYGANKSTASGDDTYKFTNSAPPFHTLHDTGGDDVIDLSEITGGSEIDLSGEFVSTIGSDLFKPFKTEVGEPTTFGDSRGQFWGLFLVQK